MKKILNRYDWAPQPMTANCSYVVVRDPLDRGLDHDHAVYLWNRDRDFFTEGYYTADYTDALAELVRLVQRYENRYGEAYPGHWVMEA
jgi:hypothetical protein